jgi:hypothetical protein
MVFIEDTMHWVHWERITGTSTIYSLTPSSDHMVPPTPRYPIPHLRRDPIDRVFRTLCVNASSQFAGHG